MKKQDILEDMERSVSRAKALADRKRAVPSVKYGAAHISKLHKRYNATNLSLGDIVNKLQSAKSVAATMKAELGKALDGARGVVLVTDEKADVGKPASQLTVAADFHSAAEKVLGCLNEIPSDPNADATKAELETCLKSSVESERTVENLEDEKKSLEAQREKDLDSLITTLRTFTRMVRSVHGTKSKEYRFIRAKRSESANNEDDDDEDDDEKEDEEENDEKEDDEKEDENAECGGEDTQDEDEVEDEACGDGTDGEEEEDEDMEIAVNS